MTESPHMKLERLRKQACWSQEDLAAKADISVRTVRRAENGEQVSDQTWKDIASAFTAAGYKMDSTDFAPAPPSEASAKPSTPGPAANVDLIPLSDGKSFFNMLAGSHAYSVDADDADDPEVADLVREILGAMEYREIWDDLTPDKRYDAQMEISKVISKLNARGWGVCGVRRVSTLVLPKAPGQDEPATIPRWVTVTLGVKNLNATIAARLRDPAFIEPLRKAWLEAGSSPQAFDDTLERHRRLEDAAKEIGVDGYTLVMKVAALPDAGPELTKRLNELALEFKIEPQKLVDVVNRAFGSAGRDDSTKAPDDPTSIAN